MGKKRRDTSRQARRDNNSIPNRRLIEPISFDFIRSLSSLAPIEDRRTFHPEQAFRPARSFSRANHVLVARPDRTRSGQVRLSVPVGVGFGDPRRVIICVRRRQRREVLHALGKTGRGKARRPPRRSYYSDVRC